MSDAEVLTDSGESEVESNMADAVEEDEEEFDPITHHMPTITKRIVKVNRIIHGEHRITSNMLTLPEVSRVWGIRATELDNPGTTAFVDVSDFRDVKQIALAEIYARKCPLSIRRKVGDAYEEWAVNEMILPDGFKQAHPLVKVKNDI